MDEDNKQIPLNHPYLQFLSRDPELQNGWVTAHDWDHLVSDEFELAEELSAQLMENDLLGFFAVFHMDFVQDLIVAESAWADHECEHAIPIMAELLGYVVAGIAQIGNEDDGEYI